MCFLCTLGQKMCFNKQMTASTRTSGPKCLGQRITTLEAGKVLQEAGTLLIFEMCLEWA